MEANEVKEIRSENSKSQKTFLDHFELRKLIQEMQESFSNESDISADLSENINWLHKSKGSRFGYDMEKEGKLIKYFSLYRKNRLLHKIIRIQKEFIFAKNNIENYQRLTHREKEILQLLANGHNNPRIAKELFISRHTVEYHRKNINFKLKIKSFSELMRYAYSFNLI